VAIGLTLIATRTFCAREKASNTPLLAKPAILDPLRAYGYALPTLDAAASGQGLRLGRSGG
jgi:hypothetical protein